MSTHSEVTDITNFVAAGLIIMRYSVVNIVQCRLSAGRQRVPILRFSHAVGGVQYRGQVRHLRDECRLLVGCGNLS